MELKIVVCIKQVPDPEGPPSAFAIDFENKKVIPSGIPPVINPADENALEAALRLKESTGCRVIAISLGSKLSKPILSKALGVGADDLVLLDDENFKELDGYSTAFVLSKAIEKIGGCNVVMVGRLAGDWGFGQTGVLLAEIMQIPVINLAQKVKAEKGCIIAEQLRRGGYSVVKSSPPVVISVSSEVGNLRNASLKDIAAARKKPVTLWRAADLGVDSQALTRRKVHSIQSPSWERECAIMTGQSPAEKARSLTARLKEDGVI
jgi:electron transfer flavoprotein beta subunit